MLARLRLLAPAALLVLAACHRHAADDARPAAPPPPPPMAAPAPATATAVRSASVPQLSSDERRRQLRSEKDGEAETMRAPDYEGASSAATSLPDRSDNEGPASSPSPSGEAPPQASPPPPSPG